jgi:hypothetical protein
MKTKKEVLADNGFTIDGCPDGFISARKQLYEQTLDKAMDDYAQVKLDEAWGYIKKCKPISSIDHGDMFSVTDIILAFRKTVYPKGLPPIFGDENASLFTGEYVILSKPNYISKGGTVEKGYPVDVEGQSDPIWVALKSNIYKQQ